MRDIIIEGKHNDSLVYVNFGLTPDTIYFGYTEQFKLLFERKYGVIEYYKRFETAEELCEEMCEEFITHETLHLVIDEINFLISNMLDIIDRQHEISRLE